jgi:hypothetical protein
MQGGIHLPSSPKNCGSTSSKRLLLLDLERHVLYDHTRKHAINKTIHQTLLKRLNKLLKLTCSLRRSRGHQERLNGARMEKLWPRQDLGARL